MLRRSPNKAAILATLTTTEQAALEYAWAFWRRPEQTPPRGNWSTWLILAGRGFGKTRTGCQTVIEHAQRHKTARIALVGRSAADVRDVMVKGESGILACSPPWFKPTYIPSVRLLRWPNGAMAHTYSADEPDQLRGPQHSFAWADELAAWSYPDAWDQLRMGLRLGAHPRAVVTTTPRPTKIIRELLKDTTTHVTRGSTFDNRSNLPDAYFAQILARYEGTRLGRQELYAEILDDAEGALWSSDMLERALAREAPAMRRVVVAIDPAVTNAATSDETGIIVAGLGVDGRGYVLADLSGRYSPNQWASIAVKAAADFRADRIVAEQNNGGQLVEANVRTVWQNAPYKAVHASQGKRTRAEPVAALYEQGKVSHVGGFPKLADQMTAWEPLTGAKSPDRLDALVWALTELMLGGPSQPRSVPQGLVA